MYSSQNLKIMNVYNSYSSKLKINTTYNSLVVAGIWMASLLLFGDGDIIGGVEIIGVVVRVPLDVP